MISLFVKTIRVKTILFLLANSVETGLGNWISRLLSLHRCMVFIKSYFLKYLPFWFVFCLSFIYLRVLFSSAIKNICIVLYLVVILNTIFVSYNSTQMRRCAKDKVVAFRRQWWTRLYHSTVDSAKSVYWFFVQK